MLLKKTIIIINRGEGARLPVRVDDDEQILSLAFWRQGKTHIKTKK